MQQTDQFFKIGQVLKSNGTDGQVVIRLFDYDAFDALDLTKEPVFIFFDGLPVPFFVNPDGSRGQNELVHLTDIRNFEDAEEIVGKGIFLRSEGGRSGSSSLVGWNLYDSATAGKRLVGKITAFEDIPGNPCIEVLSGSGKVLVPLNEDLIVKVDEKKKNLTLNIPEGLL